MKSIISLSLAVAMLVACGGGARAESPKPTPTETPASFTGKWNVTTVLYRDESREDALKNRRERLFHKSISVEKNAATLFDRTCENSTISVKFEDAEAEAKRRHVSANDLGVITKNDRLLVASLTCKNAKGNGEEKLYRRVRDGKLDGPLRIFTADFMLGLEQK